MLKPAIAQVAWNAQDASYQAQEKAQEGASPSQIDFESETWRSWLAQHSSFAFQGKDGHRFTARKEARARGRNYWVAYRKVGGKLTHTYIGRPEDVTLARLEQVAGLLTERDSQDANSLPDLKQQIRQEPSIMMGWQDQYLSTKFFVPATPHALIVRPRLFSLLEEGRGRLLTLISAPAGFGKTTLVSAWLRAQPLGNPLVAWVSLDEADNDAVRFWSYVLTALDRVQPGKYSEFAAYLQGEAQPLLHSTITACLNRLAEHPEPLILVLDDYHLLTHEALHTSMSSFIEHLPPQVRVILSTRADPPLPLTRLRGRGQLLEVRADQLRATTEEASTFMREVMALELTQQELAQVEGRTEGWLVGLQLVGLSLQGRRSSPPSTPSHDLLEEVSGQQSYILDYLTEEVLSSQEPSVQRFLLYTSVLERLSYCLCNAVLGRSDSQQVLEELQRANLFVVPLDNQRRWYRYHALFAEALRTRLEQVEGEIVRELHLRASEWYASHGDTISSVQHAMSACDWERAADLLEPLAQLRFWGREQTIARRFLEKFPAEMLRSRPLLAYLYALIVDSDTSFATVDAWMQAAEEGLRASLTEQATGHVKGVPGALPERENLLREVLIQHASMKATRGDAPAARLYIEQARLHLAFQDIQKHAPLAFTESMIHMVLGEAVPASETLHNALAIWEQSGNTANIAIITTCLHLAAYYSSSRGQLQEAWRLLQLADQLRSQSDGFPYQSMAIVYAYQANLLREWNRLDEAIERAKMAVQLTHSTHGTIAFTALAFLLKVLLARGEIEEASIALQQAEHLMDRLQNPYLYALYVLVDQVRFWLASREISRAIQWAERLQHEDPLPSPLAQERVDVALAHVKLAQRNPGEALTLLMPRLEAATQQERWGNVIEIRLLTALAHQMRGQEQKALTMLEEAVQLAQPEAFIRSFVDEGAPMATLLSTLRASKRALGKSRNEAMARYLNNVLAAFPSEIVGDRHAAQQPRPDPLSVREQEVLDLLARGASNQEIAEALVITRDTVKRHVSNILSKLGVSNRMQAVAQARTFGIIHEEPLART